MAKKEVLGNMGTILRIDMTTSGVEKEDATKYYKQYLGGRALNHYLLFNDIDVSKVQPFDPENEIIFGVGPLGGTPFPSSGRYQATFLGPMPYSGWGDANSGGAIGPEIKYCGYDNIVIKGKAPKPTYLLIEDEKISFLPAEDLWGKGTIGVAETLIERHGDCQVFLIGPAGENLVNYANIRTKLTNSLGRCGGGAVMGSKNLKAVVLKGTRPVKLFEPEKFLELCKEVQEFLTDTEQGGPQALSYEIMSKYGTPGIARVIGMTGMTPIKNWQECGIWEGDTEIDGKYLVGRWGIKREACMGCPVHCHAVYQTDGTEQIRGGGPEYETTCAIGHKCLLGDGDTVLKLNHMLNDMGFDTVEFGNMFSTLMEWYDRGIIDESFTDGHDMTWGNGEAMMELLPKIARREGCGDKLADGPYWVGKELGEEALKYVYHQKGMCATGVETRATVGAMLSHALSPRGSHHLSGLPTAEWVNIPEVAIHISGFLEGGELLSYHPEAKSKIVQFYENFFELGDSLGLCKFIYGHLAFWHNTPEDIEKLWAVLSDAIYYATGIRYTKEDLWDIGERAYQIERAAIVMRGCRRKDDYPNWRCLNEECPGEHPIGPIPLPPIDLEKYEALLDEYYRKRGWTNDGIPTREKFEELGMSELADKMEKALK
ncbi:MAG: aldehyde ferredoxin oxidoreductase family protein [Bacillota bacterium]|jgi:aldehyde:ferredoxin oxidoreductase